MFAVVALASSVSSQTAVAATAAVDAQGTLLYRAKSGEVNTVTATATATAYVITDASSPITPGSGCLASDAHTVTCTLPTDSLYVSLGDQNDSLLIGATSVPVSAYGGGGADVLSALSATGAVQLGGDAGNDTLIGSAFGDYLFGGKGADLVRGGAGDDEIDDPSGNNRLYGGRGRDHVGGGVGDDRLFGGRGPDYIVGGRGRDTIHAGAGADYVTGGYGVDHIWGSGGNDQIYGGRQIVGYNGGPVYDSKRDSGDWLYGKSGNDKLYGGGGFDHLFGGRNFDLCKVETDGGVRSACERH
ncbi:MAG TPA: calcium-binding protein [Gaiellales bacterium]|nr:calcium-binding protein [Gaiellales bacterium]